MNQPAKPTNTPRTCDTLGVFQHRTTPCVGCANTHPAYHHLHRVHHSTAATRACTADQCQQGRHTCPCPQACELPDYPALQDAPATRTAVLLFAGVALGVVACFVVILAASA